MRCKFVCNFKQQTEGGVTIHLAPVYSGSEENKKFFAATPGGTMTLYTVNQDAADKVEQGKEYFIDISPAS